MTDHGLEDLLRENAPAALGALVRRYGQFDACEDAVQEALIAAARQWPEEGLPQNPRAWLVTAASRRLVDTVRSESARARREQRVASLDPGSPAGPSEDDSLTLLFLCCHPSLTAPSQLALTLRAVGGLTTAEIASALFVPEATLAQRISRAKQTIRDSGGPFELPPPDQLGGRLAVVLQVLYLVFSEGYAVSAGASLQRTDLTAEAIRLARLLHRLLPEENETAGLLALMLLTDARRPARTAPDGSLVPLDAQDRRLWDRTLVAQGTGLVEMALARGPAGYYLLQAAVAAAHDSAESAGATPWPRILDLYDLLVTVAPHPVVRLNRAVALAMVRGPLAGLAEVEALAGHPQLKRSHRVDAVRAHLLELAGDHAGAHAAYERAAQRTSSDQERRYLTLRASTAGLARRSSTADVESGRLAPTEG
ncbi:RNA polymerase sigma factor [Pedococcus sp. 5OH_020]|uniref:RNA polymerase sigma factor n=1 Tax=Pedococcus sp. 5OH_020 TaxID=2989814 RepID=UPI0022E9AE37|nr:DUF6596 domain-containing protein [Pedococcus sp. 5OH_020]